MPGPIAAAVGGVAASVGGSLLSGNAQKKAANAQLQAAQESAEAQREIYYDQKRTLSPFRKLGTELGIPGLSSLATLEGREAFLDDYFDSGEYQTLSDQARRQQLAGAAATGGLGSTSTNNQLARIAPTLGLQALSNQQNLFGQLTNIGLSGASGQVGAGANYANNLLPIYAQQGQASGAAASAFPSALGGIAGQLGGFALGGGFNNLGFGRFGGGSTAGANLSQYTGGLY